MQRVALINGNNINYDFDHSTPLLSVMKPWIIKGLEVEIWKVKKWKALVKITRTNWEEILCVVWPNRRLNYWHKLR